MRPETVRIAIRRADGGVSIMSFVTRGRGSVLPYGAAWEDQERSLWKREPTDANVSQEIARIPLLEATGYRRIADAEIPADRAFRDALVDDGTRLVHDMPRAREILRQRLRVARVPVLAALDVEYQRADEQSDKAGKARVVLLKQELRDITAHPGIEAAQTTDELKQVWHEALK
jgi:hypothetical protein